MTKKDYCTHIIPSKFCIVPFMHDKELILSRPFLSTHHNKQSYIITTLYNIYIIQFCLLYSYRDHKIHLCTALRYKIMWINI